MLKKDCTIDPPCVFMCVLPGVWHAHCVPSHRQIASHRLRRWLLSFVAVERHAAIGLKHTHTHT